MTDTTREAPASAEKRAVALEIVLRRKVDMPGNLVAEFTEHADDAWITANGAQMVARAWTDPEYRARMLADGTAAARAFGFDFPEHHRNLVVLENTPTIHNVIVCTLCSCTAYTIIGAPPDWYEDLDYRARVVRESRTQSGEFRPRLSADEAIEAQLHAELATALAAVPFVEVATRANRGEQMSSIIPYARASGGSM